MADKLIATKGDKVVLTGDRAQAWCKTNIEEMQAWRNSSKGMTCDGETKIHSGTTYGPYGDEADVRVFTVERARARARRGFSDVGGCCELIDPDTGRIWWAERDHLRLATPEDETRAAEAKVDVSISLRDLRGILFLAREGAATSQARDTMSAQDWYRMVDAVNDWSERVG